MNNSTVDLVIIGAGPAGMAAACQARSQGLSVVVLDEQLALGGQIYRRIESAPDAIQNILGADYVAGQALAREFKASGAIHITGAVVWNVAASGEVNYVANGHSEDIVGKYIVLASGAMERPFPIKGWTLPGVMGAGAGQIMLKGAGALPTEPVVLAGCGPLLYLLAWQYLRAGVTIKALVDTTPKSAYVRALREVAGALKGWRDLAKGMKLLASIKCHGVKVYSGATDLAIVGDHAAQGIEFNHRGQSMTVGSSLVLLHQGVVPNAQLSLSTGTAHYWSPEQLCWLPHTDEYGRLNDTVIYVAGDSRGIVGAKASAIQGRLAALAIGAQLGSLEGLEHQLAEQARQLENATSIRKFLDILYRPQEENRIPADDNVLVCRCEEVTAGQIRSYVALGCHGPNQTKAFGRCGMGPCQGRFCGLTVTEIIAKARNVDPNEVGHYRVRAPIKPILLGELTR